MAEGEGCAQPTSISRTIELPWRSAAPSSIHVPPQPVTLGNVCSILNKEDNHGETSEIGMYSKSLVHTYILALCIFFPAYLKSEVEHLKKKIQNMQENQDEILRSLKSLERSLPRLVLTMTVVTPPAIEMSNPLNATNPQETASPPNSSPSPSVPLHGQLLLLLPPHYSRSQLLLEATACLVLL